MLRRVALFFMLGLALPLVFAARASAQGSVLTVTPGTASPGQAVRVTGTQFSSAAGFSPVTIRHSTRSGPVLASTTSTGAGTIDTTFPIPASMTPGTYLLLGVQTSPNGRHKSFTPGRTVLRVVAARRAETSGRRFALPAGSLDAGPALPLPLAGSIAALILLAAGSTFAVRRRRVARRGQFRNSPTRPGC